MPISMINGDLFEDDHDIIAHGVNCSGGFGSGIAGIITERYPWVRQRYFDKFDKNGWKLGEVQFVVPNSSMVLPIIANVATQQKFGYDGKKYVTYTAIEKGMTTVIQYAYDAGLDVALPKIGCGLAGGNWEKVLSILTKVSLRYPKVDVKVYYL